jgi:hypothetical protein
VRAHWCSISQLVVSPRVQYSFGIRDKPNHSYRAAARLYYQPFTAGCATSKVMRPTPGSPLVVGASNPELRAGSSVRFIVNLA